MTDAAGVAAAYPPHRAYRRVARLDPANLVASALLVVLLEVALALWVDELVAGMAFLAKELLDVEAVTTREPYLWWTLERTSFGVAEPTALGTLAWFLVPAALALALVFGRWIMPPIRIWLLLVLGTIAFSAAYVLVTGGVGFTGDAFARLYVNSTAVVWLLLPLLCGALAFTLPLSALERGAFVIFCLGVDILVGFIRYAVFAWVLVSLGPVPMPALYLLLGPLLDFVYLMGIFAVTLFVATKRVERDAGADVWAWM